MNKKLVVFTGPSAVGKATIEKHLFNDESLKLELSISATTRRPREGEIDGVHYYFISGEEFDKKIKNNEFIEWNEHFSNKYGTLKSEINRIIDKGNVPFMEVEVIGAMNILENYKDEETISFFIRPPSMKELENRIRARGSETEEEISERMARVYDEMTFINKFQHVVVNDDVMKAVENVTNIIKGNK
ncbi:MAG: guanylate kinase [Mycoplasmatales bacterium]|nr:guanylate kinase [Mycoplasmatales bacterium]